MNSSKLDLHDTKYARFIIICIKYFIKLCKPYLKALTSHAKNGNTTLRKLLTTSPAQSARGAPQRAVPGQDPNQNVADAGEQGRRGGIVPRHGHLDGNLQS